MSFIEEEPLLATIQQMPESLRPIKLQLEIFMVQTTGTLLTLLLQAILQIITHMQIEPRRILQAKQTLRLL
jgi:hypothetical protein